MPLENIENLEVDGTIEAVRIRQYSLPVYPDPSTCKTPTFILTKDKPLLDFIVRFTSAKKLKEIQRMEEY